jgi:hypothetical protein
MSAPSLSGAGAGRRSFWSALTFAALASALLPAAVLLLGPVVGRWTSVSIHLVVVACCHAAWLAPSRRQARAGVLLTALPGCLLLAVLPSNGALSLTVLAIGCALLISVTRSVLYYRARVARALLLELVLTIGGGMAAQLLVGPSLQSMTAALWGYLLVQSLFCLAPGLRLRAAHRCPGDPFERASLQLTRLLDQVEV